MYIIMFNNILKFLNSDDLLALTFAVYLGTIFERLLTSTVDGLFLPLLLAITGSSDDAISGFRYDIDSTNTIEIGAIISNSIHVIVGVIVTFYIFNYLKLRSK
jgi:large-conductance mechanosensitive channel